MDDENTAKRRKIVIADDDDEADADSVDSNPDIDYQDGEINEEIGEDDGEDLMENVYEYAYLCFDFRVYFILIVMMPF